MGRTLPNQRGSEQNKFKRKRAKTANTVLAHPCASRVSDILVYLNSSKPGHYQYSYNKNEIQNSHADNYLVICF